MSKITIKDFVLGLGFDGSEVDKGLNKIEKRLSKLSGKQVSNQKKLTSEEKKSNIAKEEGCKKQAAIAKKQREILALSKAKFQLEKRMQKSQELGMKRNHYHMKALGKDFKDIYKVKQYTQNLNERIWKQEQAMASAKSIAPTKTTSKTPSKSSKTSSTHRPRSFKLDTGQTASVGHMLKSMTLLASSFLTLQGVVSGLTQAMRDQMDAERALVGVHGIGKSLFTGGDFGAKQGVSEEQFNKENEKFIEGLVRTYAVELPAATETWRSVLGSSIELLKNGKLEMGDLKDLMMGVSAGAAAFKMGAEDQKLMWLGITQAMQKGKVQAEEITRQIGQRNPLAIQALLKSTEKWAKEQGLVAKNAEFTHEEMYKMMREGKLLAKDIMPQWGREMGKLAQEMTGGDYINFMEKSLGGAVQTFRSRMSLAWNDVFVKDSFKPMASFMTTLRKMAEESRFITDPLGAFIGNVAYEANKRLQPLLDSMKFLNSEYRNNVLLNKSASEAASLQIAQKVALAFKDAEDFARGFKNAVVDVFTELKEAYHGVVKPMLAGLMEFSKPILEAMGFDVANKSLAEMFGYVAGMVGMFKLMGMLPVIGSLLAISKSLAGGGIGALLTALVGSGGGIGKGGSAAAGAAGGGILGKLFTAIKANPKVFAGGAGALTAFAAASQHNMGNFKADAFNTMQARTALTGQTPVTPQDQANAMANQTVVKVAVEPNEYFDARVASVANETYTKNDTEAIDTAMGVYGG